MFKWRPSTWAGLVPNGLGQVKPNHYLDIFKVIWANRTKLPYALRVLRKGVCDGCALDTTGMRDLTMKGIHLCTVRLNLLRLNTMSALDPAALCDVAALRALSSTELRNLGRLPYALRVLRKGEPGFKRIPWSQALDLVAERIRQTRPERLAFYLTSRGISNEVYYVAQKVARFLGTNNIDNAARICHSPSTTALKRSIDVGASTCSYKDWLETDLLILIGSDIANNQPVTTKYIYYAKQRGAKDLVVNPFREPGLERYCVPSVAESAVFGTKLTDEFFPIHTGGDVAFLSGVLKHLVENGWLDDGFIAAHTSNLSALGEAVTNLGWPELEASSGTTREERLRFARIYAEAKSAIFIWSMGITQHSFGVQLWRSKRTGYRQPGPGSRHGWTRKLRPHADSP